MHIGKIESFKEVKIFDIVISHVDTTHWRLIQLTEGALGKFLRIHKWYIKYAE